MLLPWIPQEQQISVTDAMDVMIRWFCLLFENQFGPDDVLDGYPVDRLMHDIALALMAVQTQTTEILSEFPTKAAKEAASPPKTAEEMAWMRTVCGRLKSDYRYSKDIVYNNFPWPTPTDAQKARIEQTAQAILDARALYPDCSLADLYDEATMPPELRKAHQQNDRAVMEAYGMPVKGITEAACVAELMKRYQELAR